MGRDVSQQTTVHINVASTVNWPVQNPWELSNPFADNLLSLFAIHWYLCQAMEPLICQTSHCVVWQGTQMQWAMAIKSTHLHRNNLLYISIVYQKYVNIYQQIVYPQQIATIYQQYWQTVLLVLNIEDHPCRDINPPEIASGDPNMSRADLESPKVKLSSKKRISRLLDGHFVGFWGHIRSISFMSFWFSHSQRIGLGKN